MGINQKTFLTDFAQFCKESTDWCAKVSENEATVVSQIIMEMVSDLDRRAEVSSEALQVLDNVKNEIAQLLVSKNIKTESIVSSLKKFSGKSNEVTTLLNPLVEALQFQDRLRQNLENISKILLFWASKRSEKMSEVELGSQLLKYTTSKEERDLIRSVIVGLEEEQTPDDALIMF